MNAVQKKLLIVSAALSVCTVSIAIITDHLDKKKRVVAEQKAAAAKQKAAEDAEAKMRMLGFSNAKEMGVLTKQGYRNKTEYEIGCKLTTPDYRSYSLVNLSEQGVRSAINNCSYIWREPVERGIPAADYRITYSSDGKSCRFENKLVTEDQWKIETHAVNSINNKRYIDTGDSYVEIKCGPVTLNGQYTNQMRLDRLWKGIARLDEKLSIENTRKVYDLMKR